jgi:hypothetical protein
MKEKLGIIVRLEPESGYGVISSKTGENVPFVFDRLNWGAVKKRVRLSRGMSVKYSLKNGGVESLSPLEDAAKHTISRSKTNW